MARRSVRKRRHWSGAQKLSWVKRETALSRWQREQDDREARRLLADPERQYRWNGFSMEPVATGEDLARGIREWREMLRAGEARPLRVDPMAAAVKTVHVCV